MSLPHLLNRSLIKEEMRQLIRDIVAGKEPLTPWTGKRWIELEERPTALGGHYLYIYLKESLQTHEQLIELNKWHLSQLRFQPRNWCTISQIVFLSLALGS